MGQGGGKSLPVWQNAQTLAGRTQRAAELRPQLDLANRVGLLSDGDFSTVDQPADEIARMLRGLINARPAHA